VKISTILSARIKKYWHVLGPGLITGASDDDPSGIATYSQAGAGFGFATLWTAIITFPLMAAVQEMCARIGMVTQEGLTGTLKKKYPKSILYLMAVVSCVAHCRIIFGFSWNKPNKSTHLHSGFVRFNSTGNDCHNYAHL
jgi:Mn2+/Fe2+ NRAMP family transporter